MLKLQWWHIIGIGMMFLTASLVFMWFDTTLPYEFDASQSKITLSPAEGGGMQISVEWKAKVNRVCPGTKTRELFDPTIRPPVRLAIYDPESTEDRQVRTFKLPRRISAGLIGYRAHLSYKCNWLQRFFPLEYDTPDLFFELPNHTDN